MTFAKTKAPIKKASLPTKKPARQLTPEDQFWKEVETKSKSLIADLIEKTLPISATPDHFDLEKDADYRTLLRDDLPNYYADSEEYQEKIAQQIWNAEDVDYAVQDLVCAYFDIVVKGLADWLSSYPAFETMNLSALLERREDAFDG